MSKPNGAFVYRPGQRVYVSMHPCGCFSMRYLNDKVVEFLKLNKIPLASESESADILIFITCAFDNVSEKMSIGIIEQLLSGQPQKQSIIMGCLSKINPQALIKHKAILIGPKDADRLNELFDASVFIQDIKPVDFVDMEAPELKRSGINKHGTLYPVQIALGCANQCSYCAIHLAHGFVSSRPMQEILNQIKTRVSIKRTVAFLLAQDCASYGLDIGCDLGDLLNGIMKIRPSEFFIALEYCEPSRLLAIQDKLDRETILRIVYLKISLQSASDKVLRLMNRKYVVDDVIGLVRKLKRINPSIFITSEIMYGFPGEERDDLKRALDVANFFDGAQFNLFTPRKNTPAAAFEGQLSVHERKIRTVMVQQGCLKNPKVTFTYPSLKEIFLEIK